MGIPRAKAKSDIGNDLVAEGTADTFEAAKAAALFEAFRGPTN